MKTGVYKLSKNLVVTSTFLVPGGWLDASSYWGPTNLEWSL